MPRKKLAEDFQRRVDKLKKSNPDYAGLRIKNIDELRDLEREERKRIKALTKEKNEQDLQLALADKSLFHAQSLYLNHVSLGRIEQMTGYSAPTLRGHIYKEGGWKDQRDQIKREMSQEIKHQALGQLRQITGVSLELIFRSLEACRKTHVDAGTAPSLYEAQTVANIWAVVHKAKILEEANDRDAGKETMTPEQIIDAFANDPYFKYAIADRQEAQLADDKEDDVEAPSDRLADTL